MTPDELEKERYERHQRALALLQETRRYGDRMRLEREKLRLQQSGNSAAAAQQAAAQLKRDKLQAGLAAQSASQRAQIGANAAEQQAQYARERDQRLQAGLLQREKQQQRGNATRDRQQAFDQQYRDQRQFGYSTEENNQQHGHQLERDAFQNDYDLQRQQQQHGNTLERDAVDFQYNTARDLFEQRHTLQRDQQDFGQQLQRDDIQNDYEAQRDERQFGYQKSRDARQQAYEMQTATQREVFNVTSRWQEQVQQARNSGFDFSPKQQEEMRQMEDAFRRNVLNGPLDEGLKQQAMLQYQRKLSAIIPNQKVQNPQDVLNGSLQYHEPTDTWYMQRIGTKGNPEWEPIGSGRSQQGAQAADQEKQEAALNKLRLEREHALQKVHKEVVNEYDEDTEERKFKTPAEINAEVLRRFAPDEEFYTRSKLEPHGMFRMAAQQEQLKEREKTTPRDQRSQYDVSTGEGNVQPTFPASQPNMPSPQTAKPSAGKKPSKPLTVSSTNFDEQLNSMLDSGDQDAALALMAIKTINEAYGAEGPPPGSEDDYALIQAMKVLQPKGVALSRKVKPAKPIEHTPLPHGFGGY